MSKLQGKVAVVTGASILLDHRRNFLRRRRPSLDETVESAKVAKFAIQFASTWRSWRHLAASNCIRRIYRGDYHGTRRSFPRDWRSGSPQDRKPRCAAAGAGRSPHRRESARAEPGRSRCFARVSTLEEPKPPTRLGYEAAGTIEAVGPGVEGFKVGDAVSTIPAFSISEYGVYGDLGRRAGAGRGQASGVALVDRSGGDLDAIRDGLRRAHRHRRLESGRHGADSGGVEQRRHRGDSDRQPGRRDADCPHAHEQQATASCWSSGRSTSSPRKSRTWLPKS